MLERAGVVQSLTMGVAPIVVVISSVCTFTLHMALGHDLTAAEVCCHCHFGISGNVCLCRLIKCRFP